jgi:hypothetical protein
MELPKTISGKIRRVELRKRETSPNPARREGELTAGAWVPPQRDEISTRRGATPSRNSCSLALAASILDDPWLWYYGMTKRGAAESDGQPTFKDEGRQND